VCVGESLLRSSTLPSPHYSSLSLPYQTLYITHSPVLSPASSLNSKPTLSNTDTSKLGTRGERSLIRVVKVLHSIILQVTSVALDLRHNKHITNILDAHSQALEGDGAAKKGAAQGHECVTWT
jgi:hypothetical protein